MFWFDIKQIFAYNIKRIRKRMGLTQEEFAEKAGIQVKTIGNYESERTFASFENIEKLSNILDVEPSEWFSIPNKENSTESEKIKRINSLLNKLDAKRLDDVYRIISVLYDKNHFVE